MSRGAIKKKLVHSFSVPIQKKNSFSVRYSTEAVSCPQQRVGVNNGRRTLTLLRLAGLMCKYTYGRGPGPHVRKGGRVWWPFPCPWTRVFCSAPIVVFFF